MGADEGHPPDGGEEDTQAAKRQAKPRAMARRATPATGHPGQQHAHRSYGAAGPVTLCAGSLRELMQATGGTLTG